MVQDRRPTTPSKEDFIRTILKRLLIREKELVLESRIPSFGELSTEFEDIKEFGLYLHIPFCEQICSYCPYNKEIYKPDLAKAYTCAVKREIDFYSSLIGNKPVTSFYIGGGTPTTMLYSGIKEILEHIFFNFNIQCKTHMESHPNHLTSKNLNTIINMGVKYLSMGLEAMQDKHLKMLGRPYTAEKAKSAIKRAVNMGFECVNVDIMFALPNQTYKEIEQSGHDLVDTGVDQVAAYPIFRFPYTKMGATSEEVNYNLSTVIKRRKMLGILENIFYAAGFERTSVWAFTKKEVPKYCSVAVPLYIGLGASGGTYLKNIFYLNTFNVSEYIKAIKNKTLPIALSLNLSEKMQMAWWFYWRIYETRFKRSDFMERFGKEFDEIYGKYIKILSFFRFLNDNKDQIVLTDRGSYWLHAIEDLFSISYISKLWGTSKQDPWPKRVEL
ncbi:MAG: radical SAM protein [Actinomycetia bacterium]|nr:radical SAM protein [Actinomycetes bacterium]